MCAYLHISIGGYKRARTQGYVLHQSHTVVLYVPVGYIIPPHAPSMSCETTQHLPSVSVGEAKGEPFSDGILCTSCGQFREGWTRHLALRLSQFQGKTTGSWFKTTILKLVNGKDYPWLSHILWKIKFMFQTTNQEESMSSNESWNNSHFSSSNGPSFYSNACRR